VNALLTSLAAELGADAVRDSDLARYLSDETETQSLIGDCEAVVLPRSTAEVAAAMAWAYRYNVPLVPRGGGTGYAGGAVPSAGSVVLSLERLNRIRTLSPELWRMEVEAGVTTHTVRRLARENGLYYPPDPGAGEQSQIGGNIATNAGGPHAFKYGTTRAWVTGIEAVVPPGEVIVLGGPIRKDAAGFALKDLLIGSEGTLGVVTAAWLRLIPAPEASWPVLALFDSVASGTDAIAAVMGSGLVPAALEFVDGSALRAAPISFGHSPGTEFCVLCDADGAQDEASRLRDDLISVLSEDAVAVHAPTSAREAELTWRWREAMTGAVTAQRGGKLSEDIVVPLDRLREAIERTRVIGDEIGLPSCSWGHAGDGNLHSTFMIDRENPQQIAAARHGADRLFALALELGGSISGEHGIGIVKSGFLEAQWPGRAYQLHMDVKDLFDPKGLLNPGKKL
jgi:glycolate oxidase subunit GlcD